ncbi:hypothetical protein [Parapedobacter sp. 10938]|uniref:hypothetical protein n=1 Tax=Parapedobacter flavus TaxID=3110225 RepID=UPI002DB5EA0A|nr:hypothetical protein [Parapedobacter sp. 10938]MEC3878628.1 hypothetical protein [Parapedobacter sp. 10938]
MEKINIAQLEQLLTLDTEVVCSMEHEDQIESRKNLSGWVCATTITTTMTTDG